MNSTLPRLNNLLRHFVSSSSGEMATFTLNTGATIPKIGLGTWKSQKGEVKGAVLEALKSGYKLIDCAAVYANEAEIGEAFSEAFSTGVAKREDIFITSKLWNSEHAKEHVKPACKKTLEDLQLDYLDLYMIHWPQAFQHVDGTNAAFPRNEDGSIIYDMKSSLIETWRGMEELYKEGLVKAIGLSNFNISQIQEILEKSTVKPAVLQIEIHPYFQQQVLTDFCKKEGIVVMAYSPFASNEGVNEKGEKIVKNSVLAKIGKPHNKTAAQVAIGWSIQRGNVCIPKSVTPARIKQNLEAANLDLSESEIEEIRKLDRNFRVIWGGPKVVRNGKEEPRDSPHPFYPF